MSVDLLRLLDLEPPVGDLSVRPALAFTRAVWTTPIDSEADAPEHRIIHSRCLQLHRPTRLQRLGLRRVPGYHKCGSGVEIDWPTAFRVWAWDDGDWRMVRQEADVPDPAKGETLWFDMDGIETSAVIIEARRCAVDGWWTSWPLVSEAFLLEGEHPGTPAPRRMRLLTTGRVHLGDVGPEIHASRLDGHVHYRTPHFQVAFSLSRPGIPVFRLRREAAFTEAESAAGSAPMESAWVAGTPDDRRASASWSRNLMRGVPGAWLHGPFLHRVGAAPDAAPSLRFDAEGTVEIDGPHVRYDLSFGARRLRLDWEVHPDELVLHVELTNPAAVRVWDASAWSFGFDIRTAPPHALGRIVRQGRSGGVRMPAWLVLPALGDIRITQVDGSAALRSEAVRHNDLSVLEVRLGETPQPLGDSVLEAGRHQTSIRWKLDTLDAEIADDAPAPVREAVEKRFLTALTYRPDTATLSNNGASIHCPISMDGWAATATRRTRPILANVHATDFLRDSLERWLNGGPGYASGPLRRDGGMRPAEDEYIMTGTAALLGLSDYLRHSGTADWLDRFREPIDQQISAMKRRDLDGDGLVESPYRTGVSGTGQWSTCWFDVISFGWKDAFANALLYAALNGLAESLPRLGHPGPAAELGAWARALRDHYFDAFYNPETGWLAGWRCSDDRLHDYAFLPVNGAAAWVGLIPENRLQDLMGRLWDEFERVSTFDPTLGLPGNLHPIADEDLSDIMQGYPMGYYQNGGTTQSQSRHFVAGLYAAGMADEADRLLERLCAGLADARVFGGCKTGVDWRYWDGRPCGYEGLLTDQFGILGVAMERYGAKRPDLEPASEHS